MQKAKKNLPDLRKKHNADLIRRMRNGEPLNAIDNKSSWYPPRPMIQKDQSEMARVYAGLIDGRIQAATVEQKPGSNIRTFTFHAGGKTPLGEAS